MSKGKSVVHQQKDLKEAVEKDLKTKKKEHLK